MEREISLLKVWFESHRARHLTSVQTAFVRGEAFNNLEMVLGADLGADVPLYKEKREFGLFMILSPPLMKDDDHGKGCVRVIVRDR